MFSHEQFKTSTHQCMILFSLFNDAPNTFMLTPISTIKKKNHKQKRASLTGIHFQPITHLSATRIYGLWPRHHGQK